MTSKDLSSATVRFADLKQKGLHFDFKPDAASLKRMAKEFGLSDLRKLRFQGKFSPKGKHDWQLTASLGATVVQPCRVSLVPVTTRIEEVVQRTYLAEFIDSDLEEFEIPDDDTTEQLPDSLRISDVLAEALALSLPAFPRAEGVGSENLNFTEPGKTAMSDEDAKPFSGLAALKKTLESDDK